MGCLAMMGIGPHELLVFLGVLLLLLSMRRLLTISRTVIWLFHDMTGNTTQARKAEQSLGRELAESLLRRMPADRDTKANKMVERLGTRIAKVTQRSRVTFRFHIIQSPQHNAFAVPGGFVFVTTPLLERCRGDDDQVAFILAHEMSHVLLAHTRDRIIGSLLLGVFAGVVFGNGWLATRVRRLADRALTSAYSQDQELEADQNAIRLMSKAGFDARGAIRVFELLRQLRPSEADSRESYFTGHPSVELRIAKAQQVL